MLFLLQTVSFCWTFFKISVAVAAVQRSKEMGSETLRSHSKHVQIQLTIRFLSILSQNAHWNVIVCTKNLEHEMQVPNDARSGVLTNKHNIFKEKLGPLAKRVSLYF